MQYCNKEIIQYRIDTTQKYIDFNVFIGIRCSLGIRYWGKM